jgi:hypothetical protein
LLSAAEKLRALLIGELEMLSEVVNGLPNATFLTVGKKTQEREHDSLVIRNRHLINPHFSVPSISLHAQIVIVHCSPAKAVI